MDLLHSQWRQLINCEEYAYVRASLQLLSPFLAPDRLEHLYLSFNGGKDATAALFLVLMGLQMHQVPSSKLQCLYFAEPDSFEEVNEFIAALRHKYGFVWYELKTKCYQKQLTQLSKERRIEYIVMGSRKDDPNCSSLSGVSPSDTAKGYPVFLRVNPIIDWNYEQVWAFLKGFHLPYCKLYDLGYTYLGNKTNTVKNEALFDPASLTYLPACQGTSSIQQKSRSNLSSSNSAN